MLADTWALHFDRGDKWWAWAASIAIIALVLVPSADDPDIARLVLISIGVYALVTAAAVWIRKMANNDD
jgi:hypothetical protein